VASAVVVGVVVVVVVTVVVVVDFIGVLVVLTAVEVVGGPQLSHRIGQSRRTTAVSGLTNIGSQNRETKLVHPDLSAAPLHEAIGVVVAVVVVLDVVGVQLPQSTGQLA
jgi:hypothetical protein